MARAESRRAPPVRTGNALAKQVRWFRMQHNAAGKVIQGSTAPNKVRTLLID